MSTGTKRGPKKRGVIRCLLDRLRSHQDEVLTFFHDGTVLFDHNKAERDIRMMKV
ncbi:IS66 family transposase [Tengunoibacter tsumagoiensis]|uniref:IS66 family transposase n=1 Tax=Tengunoibacter tsumagoiensis TaxID=2014871 RepID=UPI000F81A6EE